MTERCANCRRPDAEKRELMLRRGPSEDVYLCDACYADLEEEFVWKNEATHG